VVQLDANCIERFWSQVDATGDCWEWTGHQYPVWKYGRFRVRIEKRQVEFYAHRIAWQILVGEIPRGQVIDHRCRNRLCVNPDHLEPVSDRVSDRVNVVERGYGVTSVLAKATWSPRIHRYGTGRRGAGPARDISN